MVRRPEVIWSGGLACGAGRNPPRANVALARFAADPLSSGRAREFVAAMMAARDEVSRAVDGSDAELIEKTQPVPDRPYINDAVVGQAVDGSARCPPWLAGGRQSLAGEA